MYKSTINSILNACKNIKLQPTDITDGRLYSAYQEQIYLKELSANIVKQHPKYNIEIAKSRNWYDFSVNGIKINLKITDGNTDNIFNKNSIIYTLTGKSHKNGMNWRHFTKFLNNDKLFKNKRDLCTEYHFLVVFKRDNKVLLKSLLDLKRYKKNPSNILQVNWNYEFKNKSYKMKYHNTKIKELLRVIQVSVHDRCYDMMSFLEIDINNLIDDE